MTISNIDPLQPVSGSPAGLGDDQIRDLKAQIVNQFPGEPGDLYDIPVTAGPRALNAVADKANQADLDATDANVATNLTNISLLQVSASDHEARISAIEADYTTLAEAAAVSWPVGSIFVSADGGTPSAKGLPGTWTVVGDGRVLLGDPTTGVAGGADNVTLAAANLPQHKHKHTVHRHLSGQTGPLPSYAVTSPGTSFTEHRGGTNSPNNEWAEFNTDQGIGLSASPTAISVKQAHLTVRFFRRTA